jgi:hypothetical protein
LSEVSAVSTSEKPPSKWRKFAKGTVSTLLFVLAFGIVRSITQSSHSTQSTPPNPNALISGTGRQDFVAGGMKTCMEKQENDPDAKALSIPKGALTKYCSCYMNTLADSVTVGEVTSLGKSMGKDGKLTGVPPAVQKKVDAADSVCTESFQKNLLGG